MDGNGSDDDFEDRPTPGRTGPTHEEVIEHARKYRRGAPVPVIQETVRHAQRDRDLESDRQRRIRAAAAPELFRDEETAPHEVFDRAPRPAEIDAARRSRRGSDAPLTVTDGAKLLAHIEKLVMKRLEDSSAKQRREQAADIAQIRDLIAHPPHEAVQQLQADVPALRREVVTEREARLALRAELGVDPDGKEPGIVGKVDKLWAARRMMIAVICLIALPALGGASTGISALITRTTAETEARMRLEWVIEQLREIQTELGRYRQLVFPPFPTLKGP